MYGVEKEGGVNRGTPCHPQSIIPILPSGPSLNPGPISPTCGLASTTGPNSDLSHLGPKSALGSPQEKKPSPITTPTIRNYSNSDSLWGYGVASHLYNLASAIENETSAFKLSIS